MRVIAVDYGDVRTGVAVSDPTGFITGHSEVILTRTPEKCAASVVEFTVRHGAELIVVGRPLNMNGTVGDRAIKSEEFAESLRGLTDVRVILWDERLTTVDANRILSDLGKRRGKQKKLVDAVAASLILQNYLDFARRG